MADRDMNPVQSGPGVGKRIAIMQPYFFPYAGYFRLFAHVDEFVLFDCVQFPRRGRVHRSWVPGPSGAPEWLTLPLAYQPREATIADLRFTDDARAEFDRRLRRLPWLALGQTPQAETVLEFLRSPVGSVVDYLEQGLRLICSILDLKVSLIRSSSLRIDGALRGSTRILAIAASRGATHYLNPPGGRSLYDGQDFAAENVRLEFLPPYAGQFPYLLFALMTRSAADLRQDVLGDREEFETNCSSQ